MLLVGRSQMRCPDMYRTFACTPFHGDGVPHAEAGPPANRMAQAGAAATENRICARNTQNR